jgi:hypothetical protein
MPVPDRSSFLEFHQRKKERKRYAPLSSCIGPAYPAGTACEIRLGNKNAKY